MQFILIALNYFCWYVFIEQLISDLCPSAIDPCLYRDLRQLSLAQGQLQQRQGVNRSVNRWQHARNCPLFVWQMIGNCQQRQNDCYPLTKPSLLWRTQIPFATNNLSENCLSSSKNKPKEETTTQTAHICHTHTQLEQLRRKTDKSFKQISVASLVSHICPLLSVL